MKEASYGAVLALKIEKEIGGRVIKISDRSTLGLPDNLHIKGGFATFIETKIGQSVSISGNGYSVQPWKCINDLRQFEVCRSLAKNAWVLYAIYYPKVKMTAVLPVVYMNDFRPSENGEYPSLIEGHNFRTGHGIDMIEREIENGKTFFDVKR